MTGLPGEFAASLDRRTALQLGAGLVATTLVEAPKFAKATMAPVRLRLMATADLHGHIRSFDYFNDRPDPSVGLARVATLIRQARVEAPLSLLLDNGDFLQGTPLSDAAMRQVDHDLIHPVINAFNLLEYDAVSIGNHEFNFGLPALRHALSALRCPALSANIREIGADPASMFRPSALLHRTVPLAEGGSAPLSIGIVGLTPPQILRWDRDALIGAIEVDPIVESARREAEALRAAGADVVVALAHTGLAAHSADSSENAGEELRASGLFDAVILGHTHRSAAIDGAQDGLAPMVMPGFWGSHLGVIDLWIDFDGGRWQVRDATVDMRAISQRQTDKVVPLVEEDAALVGAVETVHGMTRDAMRAPWAHIGHVVSSRCALLGDTSVIDLIHQAQKRAAQRLLEGTPLSAMPIISAAATFKAGGRGGPANYVHWLPGELTLRHLADLYGFPNRLVLLVLTGAQLQDWIEMATAVFRRLEPSAHEQPLIDETVPPYLFDVLSGVTCTIDLAQPRRFAPSGQREHDGPGRVRDMKIAGQALSPVTRVVLATNSFRADGGGNFPVPRDALRIDAPDYTRDLVEAEFRGRTIPNPKPPPSWRFRRVPGATTVVFTGHPDTQVADGTCPPLQPGDRLADGMRTFRINFDQLPD
jgi:2',3'-cyclic-nucleotide 2'-phosphodiesterase / 3'-nucleotidase